MSDSNIKVLFGTESGNSEQMAMIAHELAGALGFNSDLIDMGDIEPQQFKDWENVLIVIATNGDGEMPINVEALWEEMQESALSGLKQLNFAVLALGDSSYDYFCQAGIDWDKYLAAAGAKSLIPRADLDVDFYAPGKEWIVKLFSKLTEKPLEEVAKVLEASATASADADDSDSYSSRNPWSAQILERRDLCKSGSSKSVKHYSLNLAGSNIQYQPGDCIEVVPENQVELVDQLIEFMGWTGNETVVVNDQAVSVRTALTKHYEIRKPTKKFIELIAAKSDKPDLKNFLKTADKQALEDFMYGHDVLSIYKEYARPLIARDGFKLRLQSLLGNTQYYPRLEVEGLLSYLNPIQPRAYSIASSQTVHADEVHLTIADVAYEKANRNHVGACSKYLTGLDTQQQNVSCWLLPNKYFKLPEADTDIIMIGPGTGIAPFVGFLQERQLQKASGKSWLFFGDRESKTDFLYEDEITSFKNEGALTRLDVAFSRDQAEKIYVQHKIIENGEEFFNWLENGAVIFVCGDARSMAKDVENAILKVLETNGNMSAQDASAYLKKLQKNRRYLKDVY